MPLLPLLAAFVAGVAGVRYFPTAVAYGAPFVGALCVFMWVRRWRMQGALGLFFLIGGASMWLATPGRHPFDASGEPSFHVGVVTEVYVNSYNQRLVVRPKGNGDLGKVLVYYHDVTPLVEVGDVVGFSGALRPVGEGVIVPYEFSMADFSFRRGISAECHVGEGGLVITGYQWSVGAFFAGVRHDLSHYIYFKSGLKPSAASLLDAMLTGNADAITREQREAFADAGVAHTLALSGTHVAVIAFMVSLVFFPLRMAGHRGWGYVGVLVILWGYVLLTGCSPSVLRTVIMVSAVSLGRLLRRGTNSLNNLFLAALLILMFDPRALFAPGFQLSFAAVGAILLFPSYMFIGGKSSWMVRAASNWLCVCVAAVIGTGGLAAWHFHEAPVYFILANIPVGILFPWFLGGGVLLLLLSLTPLPAGWVVGIVEWLYDAITGITGIVGGLPGATLHDVYFPWWLLVFYYAAVLFVWYALQRRRGFYLIPTLLLMSFFVGVLVLPCTDTPPAEAYAMRYRYATAILIREGKRVRVLTDSPKHFHDDMRARLDVRLSEYQSRHKADSLEIVNEIKDSPVCYADNRYWAVGETLIILAGKDQDVVLPNGRRPHYLLVTPGFRGDVAELCRIMRPDTVVLSAALHPSRVARLQLRLSESEIPFRVGLEGEMPLNVIRD